MNIKQFIPPIIFSALRKLKKEKPLESYQIGPYKIKIPPGHTLPLYQGKHKLFDRFLPVLASQFGKPATIIDVGANVGDTPIMMLNASEANIIGVEASDKFFPYLEHNLNLLSEADRGRITVHKTLVGTNSFGGKLVHYDGTAKVTVTEETGLDNFQRLDELIAPNENIALIKTDTDGFDFDVLLSAEAILKASGPVLFWENQMENQDQMAGYEALYNQLESMGYDHLWVFDNFGNLMLEDCSFSSLKQLNKYIFTMSVHGCTRTLYFTDVLAAKAADVNLVKGAIEKFRKEWIEK